MNLDVLVDLSMSNLWIYLFVMSLMIIVIYIMPVMNIMIYMMSVINIYDVSDEYYGYIFSGPMNGS
jgi:hypothetical protein